MSYTEPTVDLFKRRFPEFCNVNDDLVEMLLEESISEVGSAWLEKDRAKAQLYLTAHNLSIEGEPERSNLIANGGTPNNASLGSIIEMRDRDVQVKFSDKSARLAENSNLGETTKGYLQTSYGERFLKLMRRNIPAVAVL